MPAHISVGPPRRALDPDPWPTPGAFFDAVRRASIGGTIDPALRFAGAPGANATEDPYGGFIVPGVHAPLLLGTGIEDDPAAGRTTPVPMTAATVTVAARVDNDHASSVSGGLVVTRIDDGADIPASRFKAEAIMLTAGSVVGLTFATAQVLSDSFSSFAALLERTYRDEFGGRWLEERIHGTGSGEFLGILNAPATITVAAEPGQPSKSVVWQNVVAMRQRIWRYRQAVWIATPDLVPQITTLTIPVGEGGAHVPAWQPGNADTGTPDMLLGRPLYYDADVAPAAGERGDLMLINWSQYLDGTLTYWSERPDGIRIDSSIVVRWHSNETAFRFIWRGDGRPWWTSPLTPRRAAQTQSPFVVLGARS